MQSEARLALLPIKKKTFAPESWATRAAVSPAEPPPMIAIVFELLICRFNEPADSALTSLFRDVVVTTERMAAKSVAHLGNGSPCNFGFVARSDQLHDRLRNDWNRHFQVHVAEADHAKPQDVVSHQDVRLQAARLFRRNGTLGHER